MRAGVILVAFVAGCAGTDVSTPPDAPTTVVDAPSTGGRIGGLYALPESLTALAASTRAAHGVVVVVRTLGRTNERYTEPFFTGIEDLYQTRRVADFELLVVDPLGASLPAGTHLVVSAIVGPIELVDGEGRPRTDWATEEGPPLSMHTPPLEGDWVDFGLPTRAPPDLGGVLQVAALAGGVVSGEHTRAGTDVALDALRLP